MNIADFFLDDIFCESQTFLDIYCDGNLGSLDNFSFVPLDDTKTGAVVDSEVHEIHGIADDSVYVYRMN